MEKSCAHCLARLPYSSFYAKKGTADGLYGFCKPCANAASRAYQARNKCEIDMQRAAFRAANREALALASRTWGAKNVERQRSRARAYAASHREERRRYNAAWQAANKDELKPYYAEKTRRRFAARIKATPAWADREAIMAIYVKCRGIGEETGIAHHVDHIVPLISPLVCGLHVEYNLQIMPAADNLAKSNRFEVETF